MRRPITIGVALMLAVMAVSPAIGGSGDTPGDPIILRTDGQYTFTGYGSESTSADETYLHYQVFAPGDSVLVWSLEHVPDPSTGDEYIIKETLRQIVAGNVVRLAWYGVDNATGDVVGCQKWVKVYKHTSGGCACSAGW